MKKYKEITHRTAYELIMAHRQQATGGLFSVAWDRRTDSEDEQRHRNNLEVITGRFGVKKHLKTAGCEQCPGRGSSAAYDRFAKQCFCIWCTYRKYNGVKSKAYGYRSIPFDKLRWLKLDKVVYRVVHLPPPAQH